jgi:signal transduction histidine kinase
VLTPRPWARGLFAIFSAVAAIEGAIEVKTPPLGEAVTHLSWLCPSKASLLALARGHTHLAWLEVRRDPSAVLLVLRQGSRFLPSPSISYFPAVLHEPCILEGALEFLKEGESLSLGCEPGFVDWCSPEVLPILRASLAYAWTAHQLAERTGQGNAENAWVTALLAPLGWFAACALSPEATKRCLHDSLLAQDPFAAQQKHWLIDHSALARRLLRRWRLPNWLSLTIEHLGLAVDTAVSMGADPVLLGLVQAAIGFVEQHAHGLHLSCGSSVNESLIALDMPAAELEALSKDLSAWVETIPEQPEWVTPYRVPLLRDVLRLASEIQRVRASATLDKLEREHDQLHRALENQWKGETERLHVLKLQALAEFAGGAAHEINNPLAVISGQAQYLLGREPEPEKQQALQAIISQTRRVDHVLTELMQFARPSRPHLQHLDLPALMREVTLALTDLALKKQVQLISPDPDPELRVDGDSRQLQTALECMLRNAIEAAPDGGWASLRVQRAGRDRVEWIIEDNGVGPSPAQREHMFDPFYSGRHAGRGRGLGLPTAWRLAREHGGEVRFDPANGSATRFILSIPIGPSAQGQATSIHRVDGSDSSPHRSHDLRGKKLNGHTSTHLSDC